VSRVAFAALTLVALGGCKQKVCEPWHELGLPVKKVLTCNADRLEAQTEARGADVEALLASSGYVRAFDASKPKNAYDKGRAALYKKGEQALSVAVVPPDLTLTRASEPAAALSTYEQIAPGLELVKLVRELGQKQAAMASSVEMPKARPAEKCAPLDLDAVDADGTARRALVLQDLDHVKMAAAGKAYQAVFTSEVVTAPDESAPLTTWLAARREFDARSEPRLVVLYKVLEHTWQTTSHKGAERRSVPGTATLRLSVVDTIGVKILCATTVKSTYTFAGTGDGDAKDAKEAKEAKDPKERADRGVHDRNLYAAIARSLAAMHPDLATAAK
jgi:hypothetical protein